MPRPFQRRRHFLAIQAGGLSPLLTDLVSHWSLEEASGTRADDYSTNNLTDNNTVTMQTGKVGNAAEFTAANSESLSIADNAALSVTGSMSVAAWVYLASKPTVGTIVCKGDLEAAASIEYALSYASGTDRFRFTAGNGTSFVTVTASNFGAPSLDTWYYVVGWHETGVGLSISVNNGTANTASHLVGIQNGAGAFRIGADGVGARYWNGRIDQPLVAKRLWTADERTFLYNAGSGRSWSDVLAYRG